jgi:hypothetical protein
MNLNRDDVYRMDCKSYQKRQWVPLGAGGVLGRSETQADANSRTDKGKATSPDRYSNSISANVSRTKQQCFGHPCC